MRLAAYACTSTVLAAGVLVRALHQRANFYSACVYLAQSNACLMVLTNLALLGLGSVMLGLQKLLYGPLRPIEVEQLYEKAWYAITETCLAMTIFRDEVGGWFLVMFVGLLIGKVWGWIGEGRVEILEQQPPTNPRLFHARLCFSLMLSSIIDILLLRYSVQTVLLQARPNMMVMFAFEFAVLTVTSLSTTARYLISLYELSVIRNQIKNRRAQLRNDRQQSQNRAAELEPSSSSLLTNGEPISEDDIDALDIDVPGWEDKGKWIFYLDLTTDFFKLVLYLTFFCVLCMFYGMPIHIIRDVALTIRSFYKRISDFIRYRQATKDMNIRYPDATSDEIASEDVCIICREEMRPWQALSEGEVQGLRTVDNDNSSNNLNNNHNTTSPVDERFRPKKLPCGHILHCACLRSWLERQQNCPTCRAPVLISGPTATIEEANPQHERAQNPLHQPLQQQQGRAPYLAAARRLHQGQNVFNFGPFRLVFGIRHGQAEPNHNAAPPNHHEPYQVAVDVQQPNNALNSLRQAPNVQSQNTPSFPTSNVQAHLHQIEQQLAREIGELHVQTDQLFLVQILQAELARLRVAQTSSEPVPQNISPINNASQVLHQSSYGTPSLPSMQLGFVQQPPSVEANLPNLPHGLNLPSGWSILPLQRLPRHDGPNTNSSISTWVSNNSPFEHISVGDVVSRSNVPSEIVPNTGGASDDLRTQATAVDTRNSLPDDDLEPKCSSDMVGSRDENLAKSCAPEACKYEISEGSERLVSSSDVQASMASSSTGSDLTWAPSSPAMGNNQSGTSRSEDFQRSSKDGHTQVGDDDEDMPPLAGSSYAKGKGKAATVEDYVEDGS